MRDPIRALLNRVPVPYTAQNQQRFGDTFGHGRYSKAIQLSMMGSNSTLFSIINKTSTSVASVCWHMHVVRRGAVCDVCEAPDVEHVESSQHGALKVLERPNDFYTTQEYFESGQQHVDLTGEGWTVIGRINTVPYELWNVSPARMEVVTSPSQFIKGYIYKGPNGEDIPLKREDVLTIRMPNPEDPHRGLSPVQTVMNNLDSARFSSLWNRNFFLNGARPDGLIRVPTTMTDRQWTTFQDRYAASHKGIQNAHRVGVLEAGMEWVDVKFSQKDMMFVELAGLDKATIREAYGMSKFALGDLEDVNRATAEAAMAWYGTEITTPRLDRWKGMLNNDFLKQFPGYDPRYSLVYKSPVPADREADRADKETRAKVYLTLRQAGVVPDDAAKQAGLPPMRTAPTQTAQAGEAA